MRINRRRSAFTLVEMIVVIGIMVVLMALAVAVIPRVQERSKAARGADQLQGWLLIAKQTALRDKFPRGIRLNTVVDLDANIVHAHSLQYIEQPPDLGSSTFGAISVPVMPPTPPSGTPPTLTVQFLAAGTDLTYGYPPANQDLWAVQPGDFLLLYGGNMHLIPKNVPNAVMPQQIQVLYNPQNPLVPSGVTNNYSIIRQPRPLAGEVELLLPKDIIIDLSPGHSDPSFNPATAPSSVDIMFSPSGAVIGDWAQKGKIILWVRDETQDTVGPSGETLITIYTRNGLIAAHPPDLSNPPSSYWNFTQDGRSSGM